MLQQPLIKHIIFDLSGVIFHDSRIKQLRSIGIGKTLMYILTHRKEPVTRFYEALRTLSMLEPKTHPYLNYKNIILPQCITNLMLGTISHTHAIQELDRNVQKLIDQNFFISKREVSLMKKIMYRMVDSKESTVNIFKLDPKIVTYIQQLKQTKQYTISLLSNLDKEAYIHFRTMYPDVFSLFDTIVISAHVHLIKPYPEIYTLTLAQLGSAPNEAIFIDDQQENIDGAVAVGIPAIRYTNLQSLKANLAQFNIIA
jgi:HAD superfamily hydrolase (TIGR01509 family)